ncbi:hypothetical protein [Bradyrhizobium jicamae]|uniref:hypothetical protein n=1 Tax=Bradyrhizobium jicamae TaxID=280332 RepID=UPI00201227E7|nr:hypothetical protein [Bradyrhizobium jicamae]
MTAAFHVQVLLDHFRIDAAQLQLGREFESGEILQRVARQAEQPERKAFIDFRDVDFSRAALLLGLLARARFRLDSMLNETIGHIWKFFGNVRKLKNPFKYAVRRRAGAEQKCIENIERTRRNISRATRCVGHHDRHVQKSRVPSCVERSHAAIQARLTKKVDARFQNARFATDRFKKIDNVDLVIRKKLPSRDRRKQDRDHVLTDHPYARCMHVFVWR